MWDTFASINSLVGLLSYAYYCYYDAYIRFMFYCGSHTVCLMEHLFMLSNLCVLLRLLNHLSLILGHTYRNFRINLSPLAVCI